MEISADWTTLMRQAWKTSAEYMDAAVREIDATFGKGYAARNPALVASFMQVAAQDFHSASLGVAAQRIGDAVTEIGIGLSQVAEALGSRERAD